MWFGLAKIALQTGAKVYSNKQRQKEAMSQAALHTAEKMARGEIEYQGKLLEARQNDWKDEIVLIIISIPLLVCAWGIFSNDADIIIKLDAFFDQVNKFPLWLQGLIIGGYSSVLGIKGVSAFKKK